MKVMSDLEKILDKDIKVASNIEIYEALMIYTKNKIDLLNNNKSNRKLYYISAEFLIGKLLSNNLINLGIYDQVKRGLENNGKSIVDIEEIELEPSLGNGGLGRLAACFLDSIATLGLQGDGIGLNYHFGLFKQKFIDNKQFEEVNPWINSHSWLTKTDTSFVVPYKNFDLKGVMHDIDVVGYNNGKNKLHLFDIETINESIVNEGINFDKTKIQDNLTLFLYPDDSDENGHLLRIYQQYFMVSCGAQYILQELKKEGKDVKDLDAHVVIQINDTHPSLVIPELIRLLMLEGINIDEAIKIVSNTCAYTNHTILAEALEKWPMDYLKEVTPGLIDIIYHLDCITKAKFNDPKVAIIDEHNRVHMANLDIHFSYSVNGVAQIHTDILKNNELNEFYKIYPNKFNNKTNGITFRRWLMHTNHELASYITSLIGDAWKKDATKLEELYRFIDDSSVLSNLIKIKDLKKKQLADYIFKHENIKLLDNSIIFIQIKRLHEYKRQQMNALYIINKYLEIKNGIYPKVPITMIFGAKAAPAYTIAKDIIHLLICLSKLIANDPICSKHLQVIVCENYNVTYAENLIPAADVSEQISLASKEASGTGNMKFMLNGAVTIGTLDGANVEISELVGEDIFLFGKKADEVIDKYRHSSYISRDFYDNDSRIRQIIDFITGEELSKYGDSTELNRLSNELINKDWFMTLLDLNEYIATKDKCIEAYLDTEKWEKMVLHNISKAGYFSADRTIEEYNKDIWHLNK